MGEVMNNTFLKAGTIINTTVFNVKLLLALVFSGYYKDAITPNTYHFHLIYKPIWCMGHSY